jgi:predicted aminopeptidase
MLCLYVHYCLVSVVYGSQNEERPLASTVLRNWVCNLNVMCLTRGIEVESFLRSQLSSAKHDIPRILRTLKIHHRINNSHLSVS